MASYELRFKKSVAKDLRSIPKKEIARILRRVESLRDEPRPPGAEKLSGQERYRIRQAVYRIIYEVTDEALIITVVKIGHRKRVYKNQ